VAEELYAWITWRRIRQGSREEFSRAWKPTEFPRGMLRAWEYYSQDNNEVVGVSLWDSRESREAYRLSDVETQRRRAMAPFIEDERSGFYVGRELTIPRD
jgi:heme-degrading monooxygenase HmoA